MQSTNKSTEPQRYLMQRANKSGSIDRQIEPLIFAALIESARTCPWQNGQSDMRGGGLLRTVDAWDKPDAIAAAIQAFSIPYALQSRVFVKPSGLSGRLEQTADLVSVALPPQRSVIRSLTRQRRPGRCVAVGTLQPD